MGFMNFCRDLSPRTLQLSCVVASRQRRPNNRLKLTGAREAHAGIEIAFAHRSLAGALARVGSDMSRSVQENRSRRRQELGCIDWTAVGKKRRMKSGVRQTRKAGRRDVVSAIGGAPKVTIEHANDFVFSPVSPAIVRQVLGLLPPGSIDGLRSVRLEAGLRYVNQHAD